MERRSIEAAAEAQHKSEIKLQLTGMQPAPHFFFQCRILDITEPADPSSLLSCLSASESPSQRYSKQNKTACKVIIDS